MRKIYSVEVKDKGKWREISRHKCNGSELIKLKEDMARKLDKDTHPFRQLRIKCVKQKDGE